MSCMEPDLKRKKMNTTEKVLQDSPIMTNLPTVEELREMCRSPDPFADSPPLNNVSPTAGKIETKISDHTPEGSSEYKSEVNSSNTRNISPPMNECGRGEPSTPKKATESIPWKGSPLSDLHKGRSIYGVPQLLPIKPSSNHTVMFQLGTCKKETTADAWDSDHVRLPCSPQNKYPVGDTVKPRWEMVKTALGKPIKNSQELENAIMSYNNKYKGRWDFSGLHYFFNEVIEEEEMQCFFIKLLPQIVELALQLPALITRPLPLLRQHQTHSISLTQQQIACLLANALFCTFPRRNAARKASEYSSYPDINFNRLFQGQKKKSGLQRTCEKLKCIFHYFRRVCYNPPKGNITFSRRYIPPGSCPAWESSGHFFRKLHITSNGTIESCGKGMLQMDFANKMIGGGVLGWGCVQEEIRFVICPELIVARLFTECLDTTEALIITGCEQYSIYEGYSDSFTWNGDYEDPTPRDGSGRMLTNIVAIDALYLRYPSQQFIVNKLFREINKAYVGFFNSEINPEYLCAIATGNWGCGVYHGNARLKALLQLMAASQAGRALAYFTFEDSQLRDDVYQIHKFLVDHRATVGLVWRHLSKYYDQCYHSGTFNTDLYDYLYKSIDPFFFKKSCIVKGRHTAVQSSPLMKASSPQSEKPKLSELSCSKWNPGESGNISVATLREKCTISTSSLKRCDTGSSEQAPKTNVTIGKDYSAAIPDRPDQTHPVSFKCNPGESENISVAPPHDKCTISTSSVKRCDTNSSEQAPKTNVTIGKGYSAAMPDRPDQTHSVSFKWNSGESGNISVATLHDKCTISTSSLKRCDTNSSEQAPKTNFTIGKGYSAASPDCPDQTHSVSVLNKQSIVKDGSSKVANSALADKVMITPYPVKSLWERNSVLLQPQKEVQTFKTSSPSSPTSISPTRSHSPFQSRNLSSSKSVSPPKSPGLTLNEESTKQGESVSINQGRSDILNSNFKQNRRPQCLTVQKRISDYFYEINIPK